MRESACFARRRHGVRVPASPHGARPPCARRGGGVYSRAGAGKGPGGTLTTGETTRRVRGRARAGPPETPAASGHRMGRGGRAAPPGGGRARGDRGRGKKGSRHAVDALAWCADEGRGQQRNASGSGDRASIRWSPNGATRRPARAGTPRRTHSRGGGTARTETSQ